MPGFDNVDPNVSDYALKYIGEGYSPIPIPFKEKGPKLKGWPKLRLSQENYASYFNGKKKNIGIILGEASGGLIDIDLDCSEAIELASYFLPPTKSIFGRQSKPKSNYLYYCKEIKKTKKYEHESFGTIVEIRSNGTQTVFPPSVHPSGEEVAWIENQEPATIKKEQLIQAVSRLASACILAKHWPKEGMRNAIAMALSGTLCRAGWPQEEAERFMEAVTQVAGDEESEARVRIVENTYERSKEGEPIIALPKLKELIGEKILKVICNWLEISSNSNPKISAFRQNERAAENFSENFHLTDLGNAKRLVRQFGEIIRYIPQFNQWIYWDGMKWKFDEDGKIQRMAKETVLSIYIEAADEPDGSYRKKIVNWAKYSESAQRIRALIELARTESQIPIAPIIMDKQPWIFLTEDGLIDLQKGVPVEPQKEDYLTQSASVKYDSVAKCPTWEKFLDEIMEGSQGMIGFLQRAVGYSMTGSTKEQVLFIMYGTGANGKSVFLRIIREFLGDYAKQASADTFMVKKNQGIPNDLARLRGVRFVATSEIEDGQRMAESLIKQMTGEDTIVARFLHKEFFEFKPAFKVWIAANYKPVIRGDDFAIWRRVHLIPFTKTIPTEDQDPDLFDKLKKELPGILNWGLEGCRLWQKRGLEPPEEVQAATANYKDEMDYFKNWLNECCVVGDGWTETSQNLFENYKKWAEENVRYPMKQKKWGSKMTRAGFKRVQTPKTEYLGIKLKIEEKGEGESEEVM